MEDHLLKIFEQPKIIPPSGWAEHIPLANFLVSYLKPKVFVELGVYRGCSFYSFCQAIKEQNLDCRAYGIDNWLGDEQAGNLAEGWVDEVNNTVHEQYFTFAKLLKMSFDDALAYFNDGEIGLLHIDGYHSYKSVKHDYQTWQPKMSETGVILFHDIAVTADNFGVYKLWEELKAKFPSISFQHGYGLGILFPGRLTEHHQKLINMFESEPFYKKLMRELGVSLNEKNENKSQIAVLNQKLAEKTAELELERIKTGQLVASLTAEQARLKSLLAENTRKLELLSKKLADVALELESERVQTGRLSASLLSEKEKSNKNILEKTNELQMLHKGLAVAESQLEAERIGRADFEDKLRWIQSSVSYKITRRIRNNAWFMMIYTFLKSILIDHNLWFVWSKLYCFIKAVRLEGARGAWARLKQDLKIEDISGHDLGKTCKHLIDAANITPVRAFSFPKPPETPDVSIIIPAYNQWLYTFNCLNAIPNACARHTYEVILADDNSSDETVNAGKITKNLIVARGEKNQGFLLNCNHAAKRARGRYIYFLNNDTKCLPGAVDRLVDVLEGDPKAGVAGSKLICPDGRLQDAGGIVWADGTAWNYGRAQDPMLPEFSYRRETDYVSGASLMVRRELWDRLGGFDERFTPAYFEDTDICFSARAAGFRVVYQPESMVIHYEGISHGTELNSGVKKHQDENGSVFFKKWRETLLRENSAEKEDLFSARDKSFARPAVLIIDHYVPHYDRDAGSRIIWAFVSALVDSGYNVKFIGDNFYSHQPYTDELQRMGVEVLHGNWYAEHWKDWLKENGRFLNSVILSRPFVAKKYLKAARQFTKARLFYFCHDLHFLREERRLKIPGEKPGPVSAKAIRDDELNLMSKMDTVLHCSYEEVEIIKQELPDKDVRYIQPYVVDVSDAPRYDPVKRSGLLFVGGFGHPPNADAILWFYREVFPEILARCPEIVLRIAGSKPPSEIRDIVGTNVEVYPDVSDALLRELYNSARMVLVPLRYGAGVKGKTVEAMGYGLPVACSSLGVEGLPEDMRKSAIFCGGSKDVMASAIVSAYKDDARLLRASAEGRKAAEKWFSRAGMRQSWEAIINERLDTELARLPRKPRQSFSFVNPGFIRSGAIAGIYPDGWLSTYFVAELRAERSGNEIEIEGWLPDYAPLPMESNVFVNSTLVEKMMINKPGIFKRRFSSPLKAGQTVTLDIGAACGFIPARLGKGSDERKLTFILRRISLK